MVLYSQTWFRSVSGSAFQGAVQGPEEFAEGFVIGVRSLLGHTVGKKT